MPKSHDPHHAARSQRDMLVDRLAKLFDDDVAPAERAALAAELSESAEGRALLDAWHGLTAPRPGPAPRGDVWARIRPDLPSGVPHATWRLLGDAVVRAWADPVWRERLRADPRGALGEAGVDLPPGPRVEIVREADAELPTDRRITLPLPPPGAPAFAAAEARRRLGRGAWGWLWGTPWERGDRRPAPDFGAPSRLTAREPAGRRGGWWTLGRPRPRQVAVFAGVLALALLLVLAAPMVEPGGTSGAAVDGTGSAWTVAAAVALAAAAIGAWLVRRRP